MAIANDQTDGGRRRLLRVWPRIASLPAILFVAVLFLIPVAVLVVYSFYGTDDAGLIVREFTLANYAKFFASSSYILSLVKTLFVVALSAALTVALTFPFAYFVATKTSPRARPIWILLAVLPFFTSYLIRVFAWLQVFGDTGLAAQFLGLFGTDSVPGFLQLGLPAVIITFVYLLFPFGFLCTYVAVEASDPSHREAAADLGARPRQVLAGLTLPLARAGILAGFAFAMLNMIGDYVTPQLIGGTDGALYANLIVNQFGASAQWGFGAVLAFAMGLCILVIIGSTAKLMSGTASVEFTRKYVPTKAPFLRAYSILFVAFLYAPIGLVVLLSLNTASYIGFPIQGLTLDWYRVALSDPAVIDAFVTSLRIAAVAIGISVLIGVPAAIGLSRITGRYTSGVLTLLSLPLLIPPVVIGLGLIIAYNLLGQERTEGLLMLAHALLIMPLMILMVYNRLTALSRNQELAAQDLGATPSRAIMSVTIPQALPSIFAAAMIGFALSMDEFILTFLVTGTTTTLPLYIYGSLRFRIDPSLAAIATIVLLLSFALAAIGLFSSGYGRSRVPRQKKRVTPPADQSAPDRTTRPTTLVTHGAGRDTP